MQRWIAGFVASALLVVVGQARAAIDVGIFCSDAAPPVAELSSLGLFDSVTSFDVRSTTPTLAQLQNYDAVLAYTNYAPANQVALGNVLADYVDSGGHVVLSTYAFTSSWDIRGRIMTSGYSPLTNSGIKGNISGNLSATVPGDSIFDEVDLSGLTYFHNYNFAHPGLDSGATLLATDGNGTNMVARNASENVIGLNLFPGSGFGNNTEFYELLGNALVDGLTMAEQPAVPEPTTFVIWSLLGSLCLGACWHRRRKAA